MADVADLYARVFSLPWKEIVTSTETLAEAHHNFARNLESDVERPLRDFATINREMQNMINITGHISAIAKDVDTANKKADRLKEKGGKAAADKVANAVTAVEDAKGQWDSQAPYVFEKLQALDESRLDHLRNVLTQLQTHWIETVGAFSAEQCLNALLNVQTADEIKTFKIKAIRGTPKPERRKSRSEATSSTVASYLAPPTPSIEDTEDGASQRSGSLKLPVASIGSESAKQDIGQEKQRPIFGGGLKRLGTVIGRRRQSSHPYLGTPSPERKRSSSNIGSALHFGKKSKETPQPPEPRPSSPKRMESLPEDDVPTQSAVKESAEPPAQSIEHEIPSAGLVNGTTPSEHVEFGRNEIKEKAVPGVRFLYCTTAASLY